MPKLSLSRALGLLPLAACVARAADHLPGTQPLALTGDLPAQVVAGADRRLNLGLEISFATHML
jgi:hypothetical protein